MNEKRLLILNGNPGIGKTTHAKRYCSYIVHKEENKIVRWIDSSEESKINEEIKLMIKEININDDTKFSYDQMSRYFFNLMEINMKDEKILFVFDDLESFDLVEIFIDKLKEFKNMQILITTKLCSDIVSFNHLSKESILRLPFFNKDQTLEYLNKSLNESTEDKESIIDIILKSEMQFGCYLPHRLNFMVNYINENSVFDVKEYLDEICDKTIWDENDIYFKYFDKIDKENGISMKILYFMSLMDSDRIHSSLITDLVKEYSDIQTYHKAIVLLVKNGFINEFKVEKYFQIHRLTQEVIRLYRVKRRLTNNNNIENKLLNTLNKSFNCEINFRGFVISEESSNLFRHVLFLIHNVEGNIFNNKENHLELSINFLIFMLNKGLKNKDILNKALEECYKTTKRFYGDIIHHNKIRILYALAYFQYCDHCYDKASVNFEKVFEMGREMHNENTQELMALALFYSVEIYDILNQNEKAVAKAKELLELSRNRKENYLIFRALSLVLRIKNKVYKNDGAQNLYDELVMRYTIHKYDNDIEKAYDQLYVLAHVAYVLEYKSEALKHALEALKIYEDRLDCNNDRLFCEIYLDIAKYYKDCNDSKNTEMYFEKSITIMDKFSVLKTIFNFDNLLIVEDIYFFLGKYDEAYEYYLDFIKFKIENGTSNNSEETAICLFDLSNCYLQFERLIEGLEILNESERIINLLFPNGHWLLSKVLLVKSEFYKQFGFQEQKIGKHENASKMFEEQKKLIEKALENIYNSTVDIEEIQ